jgi:thioredoxin
MKKSLFLTILLSAVIATSCGNASPKTKDDKGAEVATDKVFTEHLTLESFKEKVWDFEANPNEWKFNGSEPAIVDFYADWCGPCKIVGPIMEELAEEYQGKIKIYKIDTDDERELSSAFGIRSIPSILFIPLEGQPMMQAGAMSKEAYKKVIEEDLLKTSIE